MLFEKKSYWRYILTSIAVLAGVSLISCGGGGGSDSTPNANGSSSAAPISSFSINSATGIIDQTTKTIAVILPSGSSLTGLTATFSMTGSSVKVGGVDQVSGVTSNNFTNPVSYVVTAGDGSVSTYTVSVTVSPSNANAFTTFCIDNNTGVINEGAKTIGVAMPFGTSLTSLVATFSMTGSSVKVGGVDQVSGVTSNNFTNPVSYAITAGDGSVATYIVTATTASSNSKALTSFSLNSTAGTINESAKTISVIMPSGANLTSLIDTFSTTGSSVKVGGVDQVSGTTADNFTNPVSYVVTAGDGSTVTYIVTASVASTNSKAFTGFSLNNTAGTINESTNAISIAMPSGTDLTSLVATFSMTGSSVRVNGVNQVSGVTSNNFTSPISYAVTASDGSTVTYIVTATVASSGPAPVALGSAGNFVLFANTGMSSSVISTITGDIGVGPAVTSTAITTGFTLTVNPSGPNAGQYATSPQVTGRIYAPDYLAPTPANMITTSNNMLAAYNDARGRLNPNFTNLGSGTIANQSLAPGLYKWTAGLNITPGTTITLNGGSADVWIFQVAGILTAGASSQIVLTGGALPQNVFWQIDTGLTVGADASFKGVVLAGTTVTLGANTVIVGRLLSQTAITMNANTISAP